MSGQHATLAHKAAEEFKAMLALAAYLYVGLGALLLERTALLHSEGIGYTAWGGAAVKALVLAKFMLGEQISLRRGAATLLVFCGILLVSR